MTHAKAPDTSQGSCLTSAGYSRTGPCVDDIDSSEQDGDVRNDHQTDAPCFILPTSNVEHRLAARIDVAEIGRHESAYAFGVEHCDLCNHDLKSAGLFVDGSMRDATTWTNMCIPCFEAQGEGIGWGDGQVYAKQPDGRWRLIAGFAPREELT